MQLYAQTGLENMQGQATKLYLFREIPKLDDKGNTAIVSRSVTAPGQFQVINKRNTPSTTFQGVNLGSWISGTYEVGEGDVFRAFYDQKMTWSSARTRLMVVFQMRTGAPNQRLIFPTTRSHNSTMQDLTISGTFDLLTVREAKDYGLKIADHQTRMFEGDVYRRHISIITMREASIPKPTKVVEEVLTEGKVVQIKTTRRPRRFNI